MKEQSITSSLLTNINILNDNLKTLIKRPVLLLLTLIAILGVLQTARFGAASLDYYLVKNILDNWQDDLASSSAQEHQRASIAIADAQRSHPTHPLYRDLQGQVLEWAALAGFGEYEKSLQDAKQYYINAILLRPTWPVTYASLAMIKWRQNELDDELLMLINKADEYGPLKAEIHVFIVEFSLSLYSNNHPFYVNVRPLVKDRMRKGLRNKQSRLRILEAIRNFNELETACRWMKEEDNYVYKTILNCG